MAKQKPIAAPVSQARAPVAPLRNQAAASTKASMSGLPTAIKAKPCRILGSTAAPVDAGALLNIASTLDVEVARRAARRAGILNASGKLSKTYR